MNKKIGKALVVGGGISGIRSALDLAELGYGVTLIDRSPHLGGILSQLDYQFPTDRCGMCKMLPLVDRDASSQYCLRKGLFHENIDILLSTELASVEGEPGKYQVVLRHKSNWIDPDLCVGCGRCVDVCPVEVPDEFNAGLSKRKAVYLPVPHAIPNPYIIDMASCTRCEACIPVCPTGAIRFSDEQRKGFRILVVDDEFIVRDSLKEWLEIEEGFSVDDAESGQEALSRLSEQEYRLMLLDIKMPGMDGVEVLEKAKEKYPDLTVVMMTAYATVETAVEAMKIGALDYLIKPFDPDALIPKIVKIYQDFEATLSPKLEVGAIVLCGGNTYYNPADGKDVFGYGEYPDVVTSLEFERIFSGSGPCAGKLVRPSDGKPVESISWIQCVGSRDLQTGDGFCSNICCMFAIKEAVIAKERARMEGRQIDTVIYYMDLRTFGKSFQRYRDRAEQEFGVRFERARVHSVDLKKGNLSLRYVDASGQVQEPQTDMLVLAVGQRPSPGTTQLSEMLDIEINPWGFPKTEPFSMVRTGHQGVLLGGSFSGLKDISDSVTLSSAAALSASMTIHRNGGGLRSEDAKPAVYADVSRQQPRTLMVICTCGQALNNVCDPKDLIRPFAQDPSVMKVEFVEQTCTADGWKHIVELVKTHHPNRLLIGACLPYIYARKLKQLGQETGLNPALMDVADIRTLMLQLTEQPDDLERKRTVSAMTAVLQAGMAKLKYVNPVEGQGVPVFQQALVVGAGVAGMTAALAIAEHGYPVSLVEKNEVLGGNMAWLRHTIEGDEIEPFCRDLVDRTEKHPLIRTMTSAQVTGSYGAVGRFHTTIEQAEKQVVNLTHGITILSTGGGEAPTDEYGHGSLDGVVTQKTLEQKLSDGTIDPKNLNAAVFIQCVGSRQEPRNYCSRVCCISTLKHALAIKEKNREATVLVFYRDMMSYGFYEEYYTRAREAGITFVSYRLDQKPSVEKAPDGAEAPLLVKAFEPILQRNIDIEADLVVLATGINPELPDALTTSFGIALDQDKFFKEAESKWRPVDALKEGVFACGICHSPRSVAESVATAEAAAQRGLRILTRESIPAGRIVAGVHKAICSLCERCIDACPYGARRYDSASEVIVVDTAMCQGCGNCAAVCPNSASFLEGYAFEQMLETIDAACG